MPLYEYECRECGCHFEKIVRSRAEDSSVQCPECESTKVRKAISLCCSRVSSSTAISSDSCAPTGG